MGIESHIDGVSPRWDTDSQEAELRKSREMQQAELRRVQLEQRQALTQAGCAGWLWLLPV